MNKRDCAIIYVPGIRAKPPAQEQERQLRRCLLAGLARAGGAAEEIERLAAAFEFVGWSQQFYGHDIDIADDLAGIERLLAGQDSAATDERSARSFKRKLISGLYAIADRFPLLTRIFATRSMKTRVADMQRYFIDPDGHAAAARAMVAETIKKAWDRQQRVVLIGHSFGSVIAYDTLWELNRLEGNLGVVDCFISMGSPLAMGYIRKRLCGAHRPKHERYPGNIDRWINLAAVGEVTTQDRKMAEYFADMLDLQLTKSVVDDLGLVNQFHGPDGLNVHKSYGYMANPVVGALLLENYRD